MTKVAVCKIETAEYPDVPPFHPSERYPEYPFEAVINEPNHVYAGMREIFRLLEFDSENFGKADWNPLGWLVRPGMTVVLKPNFVLSRHFEGKDVFSIITHPSVLRAVADYVWIALKGRGKIIVADAPQYNCNWRELMEATRLEEVREFYNSIRRDSFELRDLRNYWSAGKHFPSMTQKLPGDPQGSMRVNLGRESAVGEIRDPQRIYGAVYHRGDTIENHTGDNHNYVLSNTVMQADAVISVPKLKVHKKVGVTLNVKGLVGINTDKNMLVHYSVGSPAKGGDQFPAGHFSPMEERLIVTERWMYDTFLAKRSVPLEYLHRSIYWLHGKFIKPLGIGVEKKKRWLDAGNWYGNDSAWRMAADLYKLALFVDREGTLQKTPQRRFFSVIDGVVGGDNRGPLEPDAVPGGVLLAGENLLAVDIVGCRVMGFDPEKIKTFAHLLAERNWDYGISGSKDIEVVSTDAGLANCLRDKESRFLGFRPHPGWIGHIEVRNGNKL